ncbi:MAG: hypothetical protein R3F30_00895 [Planctomycetota bacterium]
MGLLARARRGPVPSPLVVLALSAVLAGCRAPVAAPSPAPVAAEEEQAPALLPAAGDQTVDVRAWYGIPILRRSFRWDGNGEDDTAGVRARYLFHLSDSIAIGPGVAASTWFQSGADAYAGELEAVGRIYLHKSRSLGVFAELTGGWMQSTRPVPTDGTEWNMTFSFGSGIEVPLDPGMGLISGITYHHTSNALGRANDRNPSQNEGQAWIGLSFRL